MQPPHQQSASLAATRAMIDRSLARALVSGRRIDTIFLQEDTLECINDALAQTKHNSVRRPPVQLPSETDPAVRSGLWTFSDPPQSSTAAKPDTGPRLRPDSEGRFPLAWPF